MSHCRYFTCFCRRVREQNACCLCTVYWAVQTWPAMPPIQVNAKSSIQATVRGMIKLAPGLVLISRTLSFKGKSSLDCSPSPCHFARWLLTKSPACSDNKHIQLRISYRKFLLHFSELGWKQGLTCGPHKGSYGVLADACPQRLELVFPLYV